MDPRHVKTSPTAKELERYTKFFNEGAFMGGTLVRYLAVQNKDITYTSDEMYKWDEAVEVNCIYDERPKVSLLKRYNWYTEDSDIQPRILYVPVKQDDKVINARRGDLIKVRNGVNYNEDDVFQISAVRTELTPLYFICNLIPFRKQIKPEVEPQGNNKWLKKSNLES